MRCAAWFALLLLLRGSAFGGGTVGFNVKWYAMPGFPGPDENYPVTGGVVIADFNRDGIPDVAYSYPCCEMGGGDAAVIVKMGTGGGNLGPDISYKFGADDLSDLAVADLNGDGWPDIVARDPFEGGLSVLLNNGDGTFQYSTLFSPVFGYPGSFTLGDFNHDGKMDLAEIICDEPGADFPAGFASCTLYAFLGDGSGINFTQSQSIQLAGSSYNLQSADIDGDGIPDLVYVRNSLAVIRFGLGNGTFSPQIYLQPPTANAVDAVAIADFNNDSRLDVALLSGQSCHPTCGDGTPDTVWMYKNNGGKSFSLATQTQFAQHAGAIVAADLNGDLNQDLIYYNPYALGLDPVLQNSGGFQYALGLGKDNLGMQGTLANNGSETAVAFRDMDGDSRPDFATVDWSNGQLGVGIQTGGYKICPPPNSAKLAAKICGITDGATVASPLLIRASGNSPVGVNQMQVWIDGKKQYVIWDDQLSHRFTLSAGMHRIGVIANDKYMGSAKTVVNVIVP